MVNTCDIHKKQNTDEQINLVAAASRIYGQAKSLMAIQFILTIPVALLVSILMALHPSWKIGLTFLSVSVALLEVIFLSRVQSRLKKQGATLQQMFDCNLFGFPWQRLRWGAPVDSEDVLAAAKAQLREAKARGLLINWYPPGVQALPLRLARLVCQRASFWWDLRQRDRVRAALVVLLAVLAFTIFLIALSRRNTVEQMILTVYVPLAPAMLWIIREIQAQRDSIQADERGLAFVESLWQQAVANKLTDPELFQESLLLQGALFDGRSRSPMVFNWVYRLLRNRQQEQMEHKAEELVKEALGSANLGEDKSTG